MVIRLPYYVLILCYAVAGICNSLYAMEQPENSLSFIYYPTGRRVPLGHAGLEVAGDVWQLLEEGKFKSRPLRKSIISATSYGKPFFRFVLSADTEQLQEVKQCIQKNQWLMNCTTAALYPLAKAGICTVPLPLSIFPVYTALYLKAGAMLGLNNVERIEYYGNPSFKESLIKIAPGIIVENVPLICALWVATFGNSVW